MRHEPVDRRDSSDVGPCLAVVDAAHRLLERFAVCVRLCQTLIDEPDVDRSFRSVAARSEKTAEGARLLRVADSDDVEQKDERDELGECCPAAHGAAVVDDAQHAND